MTEQYKWQRLARAAHATAVWLGKVMGKAARKVGLE